MLFLIALGCTGGPAPSSAPPPDPAPESPLDRSILQLRIDVGRAAQSLERACTAIEGAIQTAALVQAHRDKTGALPEGDLHGLSTVGPLVHPDWSELAIAIPAGPVATALITVGGLQNIETPTCIDLDEVESWTRRIPTVAQLEGCARPPLMQAMLASLKRIRGRCTCDAATDILASRLSTRTRLYDPELSARMGTWAEEPNVCLKE